MCKICASVAYRSLRGQRLSNLLAILESLCTPIDSEIVHQLQNCIPLSVMLSQSSATFPNAQPASCSNVILALQCVFFDWMGWR